MLSSVLQHHHHQLPPNHSSSRWNKISYFLANSQPEFIGLECTEWGKWGKISIFPKCNWVRWCALILLSKSFCRSDSASARGMIEWNPQINFHCSRRFFIKSQSQHHHSFYADSFTAPSFILLWSDPHKLIISPRISQRKSVRYNPFKLQEQKARGGGWRQTSRL